MNVNHKIILDFTKLLKSYTINVSRGDTDSRTITILLFDNGGGIRPRRIKFINLSAPVILIPADAHDLKLQALL